MTLEEWEAKQRAGKTGLGGSSGGLALRGSSGAGSGGQFKSQLEQDEELARQLQRQLVRRDRLNVRMLLTSLVLVGRGARRIGLPRRASHKVLEEPSWQG